MGLPSKHFQERKLRKLTGTDLWESDEQLGVFGVGEAENQKRLTIASKQSINMVITNFNEIFKSHNWLLKGDISGIQDFIFNVKSEGAAKTLKARSFYVYAMSKLAIDLIEEKAGSSNVKIMYDGGGNFYLFCKNLSSEDLAELQTKINLELERSDLHLALSGIRYDSNSLDYHSLWSNLNRKSVSDKLSRFEHQITAFNVQSAPDDNTDRFKDFAGQLTQNISGFEISYGNTIVDDSRQYQLFERTFQLSKSNTTLSKHLIAKLPRSADGSIVEFGELADLAKSRTGTAKIAVLKLDVDFLGDTFNEITSPSESAELSNKLLRFFTEGLTDLWQSEFEWTKCVTPTKWEDIRLKHKKLEILKARYSDNIYPVFAGGDDCMMVGAWDAVFEFANLVKKEFDNFLLTIDAKYRNLTFSGGMVVVGAKFPVVRFAAMAQDALDKAKYSNPKKNRICVFDAVLRWDEFKDCEDLAHSIRDLILGKNEPRSILERISRSARGFGRLQDRLERTNSLYTAQVWKLFYFIRNSKNREEIERRIIQKYSEALLKDITRPEKAENYSNPQQFPVAARWAELLTKNVKNDTD
jgi:CRISPR-associated protein Csm1